MPVPSREKGKTKVLVPNIEHNSVYIKQKQRKK